MVQRILNQFLAGACMEWAAREPLPSRQMYAKGMAVFFSAASANDEMCLTFLWCPR